MVKHPFVVGFLIVELPGVEPGKGSHDASQSPFPEECYKLPPTFDLKATDIPLCSGNPLTFFNLSADQILNAINISRSLAMAYVMDQVIVSVYILFSFSIYVECLLIHFISNWV